MKRFGLLALSLAGIIASGCTAQTASPVVNAVVSVTGTDLTNINTTVSRQDGLVTEPTNCKQNFASDWCTVSGTNSLHKFDFSLDTAETPYNIYIENTSDATITIDIDVTIDGTSRFKKTMTLQPNSTIVAAKIF
ncbi:MAG: hypothetical protein KDC26_00180 [Armatimonadetes bacterium]|nr:hypothetical protein [Armatimonadota bacterium]